MIIGNPVPSTTVEPRSQAEDRLSTGTTSTVASVDTEEIHSTIRPTRQSFRVAKAIGLYPQTNTAVFVDRQTTTSSSAGLTERGSTVEASSSSVVEINFRANGTIVGNVESSRTMAPQRVVDNADRPRNLSLKKDKVAGIVTTSKTGRSKYDQDERIVDVTSRNGSAEEIEDLTVLPLQEEISRVRLVLNRTGPSPSFLSSSSLSSSAGTVGIRTFNRSDDDVEIDEEFVEPQLFATAASILEVGVSESTRLSRARSAFPKEFQGDQTQSKVRLLDYNDSSSDNTEQAGSSRSAVDIAAITGSCLATVVLLSTMGSLGFIMYRRKYLNPPQTLNSDKCSNPDSSGYIDDSTIRDNSEEMYSLDNDSFLNSLEAMTIQNYWTDSVKHTKL